MLGGRLARWTLATAMCGAALVAYQGLLHAQDAQTSGAAETEDVQRLCPLVPKELAAKAAAAVKGMSQCDVYCSGCGCKGGPGYRSLSTGHCVGWGEIVSVCGPPPHPRCARECEPVVAGCTGRAWVKVLAAKLGLAVPFLPGAKRAEASERNPAQPKDKSNPPLERNQQGLAADGTAAPCGTKKTCREMVNCEEARHYLRDCGLKRLDRDGDGVPCNSLCGGH